MSSPSPCAAPARPPLLLPPRPRDDLPTLRAFAERSLAEVRRYIANGDFPETAGYGRNTLEHLAAELGRHSPR